MLGWAARTVLNSGPVDKARQGAKLLVLYGAFAVVLGCLTAVVVISKISYPLTKETR